MDQRHLRREPRQKVRLLARAVATAEDHDLLAAIKSPIARRATTHAIAAEHLLLARHVQHPRRRARGDDERLGLKRLAPAQEHVLALGKLRLMHLGKCEPCAELLRLLAHAVRKLEPIHALGKAREVLHKARRGKLATRLDALQNEWRKVGARGIHGGGEPCATAPQNNQVLHALS